MTSPKIIQIGFNKCGTRSMYRFFRLNKISGVHWEQGAVGRQMKINLTTGKRPFEGYEDVAFYSDLMGPRGVPVFEGQYYFREMYAAYPDALFILNTRNIDSWIISRQRHPAFIHRFQMHYHLESEAEVEALWRAQWRAQHDAVIDFFARKPKQLLIFNIEMHGGQELSDFVKPHYKTNPERWGHIGKAEAQKAA